MAALAALIEAAADPPPSCLQLPTATGGDPAIQLNLDAFVDSSVTKLVPSVTVQLPNSTQETPTTDDTCLTTSPPPAVPITIGCHPDSTVMGQATPPPTQLRVTASVVQSALSVRGHGSFVARMRRKLVSLVDAPLYSGITLLIVVLNAAFLAAYQRVSNPSPWLRAVNKSETFFTSFFLFDLLLKLAAVGPRGYWQRRWWRLDLVITATCVLSFVPSVDNFSGIRLLFVLKFLHRLPGLHGVRLMLTAIASSTPLLRDIAVLAGFLFFAFGVLGVQLFGGKFRYRCVDPLLGAGAARFIGDPDQPCAPPETAGPGAFVCASPLVCLDVGFNPNYGTASFDNILSAWLTVFQTITAEGWSTVMFWAMDVTNRFAALYFVTVMFLGLIIIVLLVSVVTSRLVSLSNFGATRAAATAATPATAHEGHRIQQVQHCSETIRAYPLCVVQHKWFNRAMHTVILSNVVFLALQYDGMGQRLASVIDTANTAFNIVFAAEMSLRFFALGPKAYFKSPANVFDAFIVCLGLCDSLLLPGHTGVTSLRALRAVRVLKLTHSLPHLVRLGKVIRESLPLVFSLVIVWGIFLFVCALVGVQLFSGHTDWPDGKPRAHFDTIGWALLSVFQLFTTENWNDIERTVARARGVAWTIYPVVVIVVGSYILSQMLLCIIISAFQAELMTDIIRKRQQTTIISRAVSNFAAGRRTRAGNQFRVGGVSSATSARASRSLSGSTAAETKYRRESAVLSAADPMDVGGDGGETVTPMPDAAPAASATERTPPEVGVDLTEIPDASLFVRCRVFGKRFTRHWCFESVVYCVTVMSCVTLALEEPIHAEERQALLVKFDRFYAAAFTMEFVLKVLSFGFFRGADAYLRDPWNWLDGICAAISIVSVIPAAARIKALRALRVIRVARLTTLNEGLRVVSAAIFRTIPVLVTIVIPYAFYLLLFSLLGLSLFIGKLQQCTDLSVPGKPQCTGFIVDTATNETAPRYWYRYHSSYDNLWLSALSVFVISFQEGWPDDMYRMMDIAGAHLNPVRDASPVNCLFSLVTVFLGNWFFLCVVTGMIVDNMKRGTEEVAGTQLLSTQQRLWLSYLRAIISSRPRLLPPPPRSKLQRLCLQLASSQRFDLFMCIVVGVNLAILASYFYNPPSVLSTVYFVCEVIFVGIYSMEVIVLLIGLRPQAFLSDPWNWMAVFIVLFAPVSWALHTPIGGSFFMLLRLLRVLRLVRRNEGMQALIRALLMSVIQLCNVGFLLFMVYFVFAVTGMFYFGRINLANSAAMGRHINFQDFPTALLTVYVLSTGESWPNVMDDLMMQPPRCSHSAGDCGSAWAPLYFISLQFVVTVTLLNTLTAILVDNFHEMVSVKEALNLKEVVVDSFNVAWTRFDIKRTEWIEAPQLLELIPTVHVVLRESQGVPISLWQVFKDTSAYGNRFAYVDIMHALFHNWCGAELPQNLETDFQQRLSRKHSHPAFATEIAVEFKVIFATLLIQRAVRKHILRNSKRTDPPRAAVALRDCMHACSSGSSGFAQQSQQTPKSSDARTQSSLPLQ
eukprot:TRINITY_DN10993_c0_g1_i1.p1 TRINITY_DN10993_c0_g1~~TRINITY_DN10993_c0_g1_i1.p1  ORF type:complete len:1541 (+),score=247.19 TRINITY_DN10993_c0_g1_i1:38-4660(+)